MSRHDDGASHWGGAELDINNSPQCTSGYSIKVGSTNYMVTAGHCYASGATVYGGTGINWGKITQRRDYPNTDVELISGSQYSGQIYVSSTGHNAVIGYTTGAIGTSDYCVSGITTNNHCSYVETNNNMTVTFTNGNRTSGLIQLVGNGTLPGDSGGPAYEPWSGKTIILGSVVGGSTSCSPIPNSCIVYIEPWTRVQSLYGATIVVAV